MGEADKTGRVLQRLRNRIWAGLIGRCIMNAFLAASGLILALALLSHLIPIVYLFNKCVLFAVALPAGALIYGVFKRPSLEMAARIGDALGFQDRLATYLEYRQNSSPIFTMFCEEVREKLFEFNPALAYRIPVQWEKILLSIIMVLLTCSVSLLPSPQAEEARQREAVNRELKEEAAKLQMLTEQVQTAQVSSDAPEDRAREELISMLAELEKRLGNEFNYDDAALELEQVLDKLKNLKQAAGEEGEKTLAGILEGLECNPQNREEMRALKELTFSAEQQKKMLDNIIQMENKVLSWPALSQKALDIVKTHLEKKELDGAKLLEALDPCLPDQETAGLVEQFEAKLKPLKERLLAKGEEGFKGAGEQMSQDYLAGKQENLKDGEITKGNSRRLAGGDSGDRAARNPAGLGGGGPARGEDNQGNKKGEVARDDLSSTPGEYADSTNVQGKWQEEAGDIKLKYSDTVRELAGDASGLEALAKQFGIASPEYAQKWEIPAEYRTLVSDYYQSLEGRQ